MDFKKELEQILIKNNLISYTTEYVDEEIESVETDESNIGVASDGTQYNKKALIKYLGEKGLPLTQDYVDMASKMFAVNAGTVIRKKAVTKSNIDEFDGSMDEFIKLKNLEAIFDLKQIILKSQVMEYDVVVLKDNSRGATDNEALIGTIRQHSENGWSLKFVFKNGLDVGEFSNLGKNLVNNLAYKNGSSQTALEEVFLIFERSLAVKENMESLIEK